MKTRNVAQAIALAVAVSCVGLLARPQSTKEPAANAHAAGTFEVKLTPQPPPEGADPSVGRFLSNKQYHGSLEGNSKGEMLSVGSPAKGSAGYVAIEKFAGTLDGRPGTFALQHSGTMNHGEQHLTITVVPDSGTDRLTGLAGSMNIVIAEGKHSYTFDYTLPAGS